MATSASALVIDVEETVHERFLRTRFPLPLSYKAADVTFLGFVNRSGSNYLGELLASTGVYGQLHEALVEEHVRYSGFHGHTLGDYINHERQRWGRLAYGMKATGSQLCFLRDAGVCLSSSRYLISLRRDKIAQAVSIYIAQRTGQWERVTVDDVPYDSEGILDAMKFILTSEFNLSLAVALSGQPSHTVYYEDLVKRPSEVTANAMEFLGHGPIAPTIPAAPRFIKQGGDLNVRLADRFRRDLDASRIEWIPL